MPKTNAGTVAKLVHDQYNFCEKCRPRGTFGGCIRCALIKLQGLVLQLDTAMADPEDGVDFQEIKKFKGLFFRCDIEVNDATACMYLRMGERTPEEVLTPTDPYYAKLVKDPMIWVEIP